MDNVVLFLPECGIDLFFKELYIIAKSISKNIYFLKCSGQFKICNMMTIAKLTCDSPIEQKNKLCEKCRQLQDVAMDKYGVSPIELSGIITDEMKKKTGIYNSRFY